MRSSIRAQLQRQSDDWLSMLTSANVRRIASTEVLCSVKRKKFLIGLAACLAITVVLDQAIQFGALTDGYFLGRRIAPYDPPLLHEGQATWLADLESYLESGGSSETQFKLDAELGWCTKPNSSNALGDYDWSGSRIGFEPLPRTKTEGIQRVLAIGCSFTRGDEVAGTEAWPALLDQKRADLEIANLGVGGFGMDQALLRLRREGWKVEPDEVWLGLMPWASPRLTNMYRPALRRWSKTPAFKPRFVLGDSNDLQLIENPAQTLEAAARLLTDQEHFFKTLGEHDARIEEFANCWRPRGTHWTHDSSFARIAMTFRESALVPAPELLEPTDSELHRLMLAILLTVRNEVEERGARFRLLILPCREGLAWSQKPSGPYWGSLVDELRVEGVEILDLTSALIAAGAIERDDLWAPGHHYSPEANRIVADGLDEFLSEAD